MAGFRRGGKGERRASEAREDQTRSFWCSSLPFYGLPGRLKLTPTSYPQEHKFLNWVNEPQSVISQLKCVDPGVEQCQFSRQLISSAESYFASFIYPWRVTNSRTEIFAFDCFRLLSDRPGDFAQSWRSHIWTQAQIASECFVDALL